MSSVVSSQDDRAIHLLVSFAISACLAFMFVVQSPERLAVVENILVFGAATIAVLVLSIDPRYWEGYDPFY